MYFETLDFSDENYFSRREKLWLYSGSPISIMPPLLYNTRYFGSDFNFRFLA